MQETEKPELSNEVRLTFHKKTGALVFYIPKRGRWGVRESDETRALREHLEAVFDTTRSLNPEDG